MKTNIIDETLWQADGPETAVITQIKLFILLSVSRALPSIFFSYKTVPNWTEYFKLDRIGTT